MTGAGAGAAILILSFYVGWRTYKEDRQFIAFRKFGIFFNSIGGTDFRNAELTDADFSKAQLRNTRFNQETVIRRTIFRDAKKLELARVTGTILENRHVRNMLVTGQTDQTSFVGVNLKGAYLKNVDLTGIDFTEADLSHSFLENAILKNVNLTKTQLLGAEFRGADLTGACLESWNIDSTTQLKGAHAEYVYLLRDHRERRPSSGVFGEGEFSKLFQEVLNTVDLIFKDGIDWKAFMVSFDNLREKIRVESNGQDITIQRIENKGDGVFVVRVNVPPVSDKTEIHRDFRMEYDKNLKFLEEELRDTQNELAEAKDQIITLYREHNTDMKEIARFLAERPIQQFHMEAKGGSVGDDIKITTQGDVAFGKGNATVTISKTIRNSNASEDLKTNLEALAKAVEAMKPELPEEKAEEASDDLQRFVEETTKENPKRKWYSVSGEGLMEAAKAVGSLGKPVIDLTKTVMKMLPQ